MTVAIGSKCIGGVILYADRNVIGTDGSKTQACKIYYRNTRDGAIALASATDDAAASEALAQQILDDLSKTKFQNVSKLISQLRKNLIEWSAPYPKDLTMQYLMAVALDGETHLFFLEPRNTILTVKHKYAIGTGARVVDPILKALVGEDWPFLPKQILLYLAYMTKHAKDQEAFVGGGSNAIYVPSVGQAAMIEMIELQHAEGMIEFVDELVNEILRLVMLLGPPEGIQKMAEIYRDSIIRTANSLRESIKFPSLPEKVETIEDVGPIQHSTKSPSGKPKE